MHQEGPGRNRLIPRRKQGLSVVQLDENHISKGDRSFYYRRAWVAIWNRPLLGETQQGRDEFNDLLREPPSSEMCPMQTSYIGKG